MKNEGKKFEEDLEKSISSENIFIYKLRDSSSGWGDNSNCRFTTSNICDFITFNNISNKIVLLEAKSFKGKSCPFVNIKKSQVEGLLKYKKNDNVEAYIIFNFRDLNETFLLDILDVEYMYYSKERKSFSYEYCKKVGILIPQIKKRVRYKYLLENILYKKK